MDGPLYSGTSVSRTLDGPTLTPNSLDLAFKGLVQGNHNWFPVGAILTMIIFNPY